MGTIDYEISLMDGWKFYLIMIDIVVGIAVRVNYIT